VESLTQQHVHVCVDLLVQLGKVDSSGNHTVIVSGNVNRGHVDHVGLGHHVHPAVHCGEKQFTYIERSAKRHGFLRR
jgi:hypothetical protein